MLKVGIFGATGYTGFELVKILVRHPQAQIVWLTTESYVGQRLSDVFACPWDFPLVAADAVAPDEVDVAFLCLPHGASIPAVKRCWDAGLRAIDLSADFRLADPAEYKRWYKAEHSAPELLKEAVYGLVELHRPEIRDARLVANPGCYPTSVNLGLYPLVKHNLLASERIIVDSKSGVSGAGRGLSLKTHFVEAHDNFSPYSIGHTHRHISEMEQELNKFQVSSFKFQVVFSPHLLPVNQGILSTMYVILKEPLREADLVELYREAYAGEPFVQVLQSGQLATLRHVVYSNRCTISLTRVDDTGNVIVCSAIDNLIKGASGQAIQNMNVMFGIDETAGLV
ncbi:MAG: N-acetyl-gamma-glutamyl-phosphate reductase [Chloroflexi bacterium RBG_16_57_9]|nr:MAG: N-acetyl-gamma-glutamyl-phosphate reductase [Chloroflexi bacterium RBG_16_57_9]